MASSTQQSIPIAGIKDGIIILKNGAYRMILEVSAVNFSLKSEQEQNSLIFQYQSFLNSLHFPIEIVIRSKRLDLNPYLAKIKKLSGQSLNELIAMQANDYVDFVTKLISIANIMKKTFYVVIPYEPISIKKLNFFDGLFAKAQTFDHLKIADNEFKAATGQLKERGDIIASGLASMGLHCFQLSTEEVIELFYQIYNPEEAGKERVDNASEISSGIVVSKDEVKDAAATQTSSDNFERAIDNASMVQEQQKQSAQQRRQETSKETERIERAPEEGTKQSMPVQPTPAVPQEPVINNQVPPQAENQQNGQ